MSKYQANNIGIIGLIQSLISEQNVDRIRLYFLDLQSNQAICNPKNVDGVQQTVLETRTNWPRKVRELILDYDSQFQGVKG